MRTEQEIKDRIGELAPTRGARVGSSKSWRQGYKKALRWVLTEAEGNV